MILMQNYNQSQVLFIYFFTGGMNLNEYFHKPGVESVNESLMPAHTCGVYVCFIMFECQELFSFPQDRIYIIYFNGAQSDLHCCKRIMHLKHKGTVSEHTKSNLSLRLLLWRETGSPQLRIGTNWAEKSHTCTHPTYFSCWTSSLAGRISTHPSAPSWLGSHSFRWLQAAREFWDPIKHFLSPCTWSLLVYNKHPASTPQPKPTNTIINNTETF